MSAYGVGFHRHNSEIGQFLNKLTKTNISFVFTPHLTPMFRGILSTIYVDLNKRTTIKNLYNEFVNFYKKFFFVKICNINTMLNTNDVINTNNCEISVCESKFKDKAIILSTVDNLIKGGAGQAIQNMNILKGFKEYQGLK